MPQNSTSDIEIWLSNCCIITFENEEADGDWRVKDTMGRIWFVDSKKLKDVSAFTLIASSLGKNIPTRLSHQLIYGQLQFKAHLQLNLF